MKRKGTGLNRTEFAQAMRYLDTFDIKPAEVKFQVRVGEGEYCSEDTERWMQRMVKRITSLRIDMVVYHSDGTVEIIECKVRSRAESVGQLMIYERLLMTGEVNSCKKTLICRSIQPDVYGACMQMGINVVIYDDI